MTKRLTKISEKTIHENPWYSYKHDEYEKPNGQKGDYFYSETNGSVFIVPVLSDGRIVLTLQSRYLSDKQSIEFPGGGIDKDEPPLDAAKKELLQETGCITSEMIKMGVFEPASGMVKDTVHVFLAKVSGQQAQKLDDTEDIEILYRNPEDIDRMVKNNEIFCGSTMAVWAMVRNYFL